MRNKVTEDDAYFTLEAAYAWHYGEAIRYEEYGESEDAGILAYHQRARVRIRRCMEILNPMDFMEDCSAIERDESTKAFGI